MKFSLKLFILMMGMISGIIFVLSYFIYTMNTRLLESNIIAQLGDQAYQTILVIDRILFERVADMKMIVNDPIIKNPASTPGEISERLIQYRNQYPIYASLSYYDLNRIRLADTAKIHIGDKDALNGFWWDIMQGKLSAASDIRIDEGLKIPIVYFAAPVKILTGETIGVVVSRIPLSKIFELMQYAFGHHQNEGDLSIYLHDQRGRLLYSSFDPQAILSGGFINIEPLARIYRGEKHGAGRFKDVSGEESIYIFEREPGYLDFTGNGWIIVMSTPIRIALEPVNRFIQRIHTFIIPLFLLAAFISWLFSRSISRPLARLTQAAQLVGSGNLDINLNIRSRDEIGQFAREFELMAAHLKQSTTSIENYKREIEHRKQAESELHKEKEFAQNLVETAQCIILVLDKNKHIVHFNSYLITLTEYTREEIEGKNWFTLFIPEKYHQELDKIYSELFTNPKNTLNYENPILTKSGELRFIAWNNKVLKDQKREIIGILSVGLDITEKKKADEFIRQMAYHDTLTGLPNRKLFQERLTQEIARAKRKNEIVALMFLDLDGFKIINDTYGHEIGDQVLCEVAQRLEIVKRESDTASRIGGDEFTILVSGMNTTEDTLKIAQRILDAIREPIKIDGHTLTISASLGISFHPVNGTDPETLLKRADEAMYAAKNMGKNTFRVYEEVA